MNNKKIISLSFVLLPLLLACSNPINTAQAIERMDEITTFLQDKDYTAPTRFQLIYKVEQDYLKSDDYKYETIKFVCDTEGYKIFSSTTTESYIDGEKINTTDTIWNWIDSDWTFNSAFQNETKKTINSQKLNQEAAIVMFNKFAATVANPADITKKLLSTTSAYLKNLKQDDISNYEFSFTSAGKGNLKMERDTLHFESSDTRDTHYVHVEIKDNLLNKGFQIQKDKEIKSSITFEFSVGNVSVKLPDITTF